MRTFQTRILLTEEESSLLDHYGEIFAKVEHTLFVDLQKDKTSINQLKSQYLKDFEITARQFNSARCSIEGKIQSLKEIQKQRIHDTTDHLNRLQKKLENKKTRNRHQIHQKKQRVQNKLFQLQKAQVQGKVSICFGSRKLFRAQYHLSESGFSSHQQWLTTWREKRTSSIFLMGSKDETAGNQSCVATLEADDSLTLRIRLPNHLCQKYLHIQNVKFQYGHEVLLEALRENQARRSLQKEGNPQYKTRGLAITYRFQKDPKGWRIFASVALPPPAFVTREECGAIGVDLNVDHLALTEIDPSGNPLTSKSIPLNLYGKTTHQAKALIGDAIKTLIAHAKEKQKPLVLEKLDFQDKKRHLKQTSPKQARMLSSFAYQSTIRAIRARAQLEGVQVFEVNPAYTSQIGKIKFAKRYGLSIHHAAALCIARRMKKFSEKLPPHSDVPSGKGTYVAFAVPVRTQQRSFWSYLAEVTRKLQTALAEHFRVTKCQSTGPPAKV